jgi:hypothetical protein
MKNLQLHAICIFILSCCLSFKALAQIDTIRYDLSLQSDKRTKNAIYGELAGSGFLLSMHYERSLWQNETVKVNVRIGVGSAILVNAVPLVGLNACIGKNPSRLELGFNAIQTYAFGLFGGDGFFILGNPVIGYRYEGKKGLLFRAALTPFFAPDDPDNWVSQGRIIPWAGLSFGYAF